jgi:hypothetical protein
MSAFEIRRDPLWLMAAALAPAAAVAPLLAWWSRSLAAALAADLLAAALTAAHLSACQAYFLQLHPHAAPYGGPWRTPSGGRAVPTFFPPYLGFAAAVTILIPAAALAAAAALQRLNDAALALAPLLLLHGVQTALEVRLLRRTHVAPTIPLAFAPPRAAQLARTWAQLAAAGGGPAWLRGLLFFYSTFWLYDFGVVCAFLPGSFNAALLPVLPPPAAAKLRVD